MRLALQLTALALFAAHTGSAFGAPGVPDHLGRAGSAAASSDLDELTQPDPHVMLGQLPNGMKYAIVQTEGPAETSINFYVGAGSADETDAERGTAHFLEHMAFSGSKNFPPGALIPQFEAAGVELGRDQNAQTALSGTTFSLDLPNADDAKIDMAFRWLGDVADGLTIEPKEVERERGTILSEYRETLSATSDIAKQTGRFLLPGLVGAHREPIGTLADINAASAASIRGFYEKWYRPEVSIIVVVSNESPYRSLARIQQTFGDWRNPTPKPTPPDLGHVDPARGFDVFSVSDPHAPNVVQVCHAMDKDPPMTEGVRSHLRDSVNDAWNLILRERLDRLAESANPPIASASVERTELYDRGSVSCVDVAVRNQDWKAALATIETETRRMQLYGVTQEEVDSAKAELHARLIAVLPGGDKMTQKDRADIILDNLLHNGTIDTVEEDSHIVGEAIDHLTPQLIDDAFARVWTRASGPLVVLVSSTPAAKAEVRAAWLADQAVRPSPPAAETHKAWAYDSFGPAGRVVDRQELPNIGVVRLTFSNGVKVNFKPFSNEPDKVFIRIRFGAGQQEAPAGEGLVAQLGASMLEAGGLGKNDLHDIMRRCQTHTCDLSMAAARDAFVMGGTTRAADLSVELQLMAAFLTDPGFRPELNALLPTAVDADYRQLGVDPNAVATRALADALPRPHVLDLPPRTTAERIKAADFARVLDGPIEHDPLEVTVVGDIDEQTLTQALATTLGAIPRRAGAGAPLPDAPLVRYPAIATTPIKAVHEGPADKAAVLISWPLFVWKPSELREQRTIELLAAIVRDQLIEIVRRELGETYSPAVTVSLPRGGDQGQLQVQMTASPGRVDQVVAETRKIAADLAAGGVTPEALERVRRPILDGGVAREYSAVWWIDMLDGSWAHPDQIAAAQQWQTDYQGITAEEVQAAAKKWLTPAPIVAIALPKTFEQRSASR